MPKQFFQRSRRRFSCALLIGMLVLSAGCVTAVKMPIQPVTGNQDCVVLVHGLWRSHFAMWPIERTLREHGFHTVNLDYPSTRMSLEQLAQAYFLPAVARCQALVPGAVHVVSHSMGGIVTRVGLQDVALPGNGKVVMLSPPNGGAELAVYFRDWPLAEFWLGPAASSLGSEAGGVLAEISPTKAEVGVIMGDGGSFLWPETLLPAPNDGTVSVASSRLPGMVDYLLTPTNHVSIRWDENVRAQIVFFLKQGRFRQRGAPSRS